jgi:glycolate oxidase
MVSQTTIKQLQRIVGRDQCFFNIEERLTHASDASSFRELPKAVIRPQNTAQVAEILRVCHRNRIPVVFRGSGTGYTGGAVPPQGGFVIDMGCLNRILEIDTHLRIGIVEPMVINAEFQAEAKKYNLFYPPDPASLKSASLGGNVAENSGGPRCVKYGVTRDYVRGLEFVTMEGSIVQTGCLADHFDDITDLTALLISSEGTLGGITKLALSLAPLPKHTALILGLFGSMAQAAAVIADMVQTGVTPSAMEFMDAATLQAVSTYSGRHFSEDVQAVVLFEVDGVTEAETYVQYEKVVEVCQKQQAIGIQIADTFAEKERLWEIRRNISPALRTISPKKINEDVTVPRSKIPVLVGRIVEIARKYQVKIVTFGHAGDGNIHVNIMTDEIKTQEFQRAQKAVDAVFNATIEESGVLSGEHGIGLAKKKWIPLQLSKENQTWQKRLKKAFDPGDLMNPGKIF